MSLAPAYFNENWLSLDHEQKFHYWLVPAKINTNTRCKNGKTHFELSRTGIRVLWSHARGRKHLDLTNKITLFFPNTNKPSTSEMSSKKSAVRKHPLLEVSVVAAQNAMPKIRRVVHSVVRGYLIVAMIVLV